MTHPYVQQLQKARERLVAHRREMAEIIINTAAFIPERAVEFTEIQDAIKSIMRQSRRKPSGPAPCFATKTACSLTGTAPAMESIPGFGHGVVPVDDAAHVAATSQTRSRGQDVITSGPAPT
jgi:hypothetical protein